MSLMDIALTDDGDMIFKEADIKVIEDNEYLQQLASNRIKSISIDWFKDNIGADLEEILGLPNTKGNAELGKTKIINALIFDSTFTKDGIDINMYPKSKSSIGYEVTVTKKPFSAFTLNVSLDLVKGIMIGV